ncbi:hypothetical protein BJX99DRAFT_233974 [Aspergillus californicus]
MIPDIRGASLRKFINSVLPLTIIFLSGSAIRYRKYEQPEYNRTGNSPWLLFRKRIDGNGISNNPCSDLVPLLALFGEEVTK